MTKIQMPEPVAYAIFAENGNIRLWSREPGDLPDADSLGPMHKLITTEQAEAYANARVREALGALNNQAQELYESSLKSRLTRDGAADEDELKAIDLWNVDSVGMAKAYTNMQKAIRALIPEPPCDTQSTF